jgi:hypothetical protein
MTADIPTNGSVMGDPDWRNEQDLQADDLCRDIEHHRRQRPGMSWRGNWWCKVCHKRVPPELISL